MTRDQVIREWTDSVDEAIQALQEWKARLEEWQNGGGADYWEEFLPSLRILSEAGLEGWVDRHPLRVDRLAEVVCDGSAPGRED